MIEENYQAICKKEVNSLKTFLTNRLTLSGKMWKKFNKYCMVKLFRIVMNKRY